MKSFYYYELCKDGDKIMVVTDNDDVKIGHYNLTEMGLEYINTYEELIKLVGEPFFQMPSISAVEPNSTVTPIIPSVVLSGDTVKLGESMHCPSCNNKLIFDRNDCRLHCESCGSIWTYKIDCDSGKIIWQKWETFNLTEKEIQELQKSNTKK